MVDSYGRKINYLRISITDRCNLRCRYCMPEEGIANKSHGDIISYEDITKIVSAAAELGVNRVRITGGEPLVRLGVVRLVAMLTGIEELQEISLTTNGVLLKKYGRKLKEAGLDRINISLDTLKREKFKQITRRDELKRVMEGIKEAINLGYRPLKINTVVLKGINDGEIMDFVNLSADYPLHVRFIEFMSSLGNPEYGDRYISLAEIRKKIGEEVKLIPADVKGNGPATYYRVPGAEGTVGFITPESDNFCQRCNRLRLTADGKLRPCLHADREIDLYSGGELLKYDHIIGACKKAIEQKPAGINNNAGTDGYNKQDTRRGMSQIGG